MCTQVEGLLEWLDKRVSYFTITQFAGLIRCAPYIRDPTSSAISSQPLCHSWLAANILQGTQYLSKPHAGHQVAQAESEPG